MGRLSFLLLALLIIAILGAVWIMTGPRAAYWRGVFEASDYGRLAANPPIVMTSGGRSQPLTSTAEGRIMTDRSQAFFVLDASGDSSAEAISGIADRREHLRSALNASGYQEAQFNEGQLVSTPPVRERGVETHRASLRLVVTFFKDVDFVDLFSQPEFADIGRPEKQLYWMSDREAALAALEEEALAKVRARADRLLGEDGYSEREIRLSNNLGNSAAKFESRIVRAVVTATLTAWIPGAPSSEIPASGPATITAPPVVRRGYAPEIRDFSDQ